MELSNDELAYYNALTKPQGIMDFYENIKLIAITNVIIDIFCKNNEKSFVHCLFKGYRLLVNIKEIRPYL